MLYLAKFKIMSIRKKTELVSLKEFADQYNKVLTRRGHRMSQGYLYRLIRQDIVNKSTRKLWFKYVLKGDKEHIFIKVQ